MSAAPGRPKQARTAALQGEGTLMNPQGRPTGEYRNRSMEIA